MLLFFFFILLPCMANKRFSKEELNSITVRVTVIYRHLQQRAPSGCCWLSRRPLSYAGACQNCRSATWFVRIFLTAVVSDIITRAVIIRGSSGLTVCVCQSANKITQTRGGGADLVQMFTTMSNRLDFKPLSSHAESQLAWALEYTPRAHWLTATKLSRSHTVDREGFYGDQLPQHALGIIMSWRPATFELVFHVL